ncbi:hypothetical protein TREPR_1822 [Treponema primitia ZAS-2]|uniref:Uncharacterized protein n=1 Tax=Treponema primitia (strain ATCC BAA-887 / DSM 12427 / ZAS-2) TaxID=545694 RepID=F5YLX3_TREPZ|nr:hypothetical protein [Treponema primitia]AEF85346.1 hypothetical protein TREPR_1822 [Treponema primitia ZAS-2]
MGHWEDVERFEVAIEGLKNYRKEVNMRRDLNAPMPKLSIEWSDVYAGTRPYEKGSQLKRLIGNVNQAIADACRACGYKTIDSIFYDAQGRNAKEKPGDKDDPKAVFEWYDTLTIGKFNECVDTIIAELGRRRQV